MQGSVTPGGTRQGRLGLQRSIARERVNTAMVRQHYDDNKNVPLSTPFSSDAPHVLHAKPRPPPKRGTSIKKRVAAKRGFDSTLRLTSSSCITPRSSCACLILSARSTSAVTARAAQYRAAEESGVVRAAILPDLAYVGEGFPAEGTSERPCCA